MLDQRCRTKIKGECGLWLNENWQVMLSLKGDIRELDDSDIPLFLNCQNPLRKRGDERKRGGLGANLRLQTNRTLGLTSLKGTNAIASGASRRVSAVTCAVPERDECQRLAKSVPFRDRTRPRPLFVGFHPTLLNASLSGTRSALE